MAKWLLWKNCKTFDCERWFGFPGQCDFLGWLREQGYEHAIVEFELPEDAIETIKEEILPTLDMDELTKMAMLEALNRNDWSQQKAAAELGWSPRKMNQKLQEYGINHPAGKWKRKN